MAKLWQFAQLSDNFKTFNTLDQVPRAGRLFISGMSVLQQEAPDPVRGAGITHVLSALDYPVSDSISGPSLETRGYQHLWLQVDDYPSENLLQHFARACAFIDAGVASATTKNDSGGGGGGGVLVHCAMGVSRSATLVCAYLMWKHGVGAGEAVAWVREGRRHVQPNAGFAQQLEVWGRMVRAKGGVEGEAAKAEYARWARRRSAASL